MKVIKSMQVEPKKVKSLLVQKLCLTIVFAMLFSCQYNTSYCTHQHHHLHQSYDGSGNHFVARHKCQDSLLTMSQELIPYLDSFISDCKRYGLKYDHAYCLNWMKIGHHDGEQGVTDFDECSIEINRYLAQDSVGMKFVIYHELGHWFGLEHGTGIMKTSYSTWHDRQWVQQNWTELVDEHFAKMKRAQVGSGYGLAMLPDSSNNLGHSPSIKKIN